ncbi:MAG: type III-B CRISPR module RAMP protein Cmr6 [Rhodothermales bacterium]
MNLPLPRDVRTLLGNLQNRRQIDNLFLLFYRYVWTWRDDWSLEGTEKKVMMQIVARKAGPSSKAKDYLLNFVERQQALLNALEEDGWKPWRKDDLVTDARLIAGLGYKGALEVGLTLHPLYGFPYLPGTAVKGIARAYAEHVINAPTDLIRKIFGSPEKDPRKAKEFRVGCVRFFDALPTSFPKLEVDVMTPHFGDYYMDQTGRIAPGDWHSPVPVSFLTVAEGQSFCFSLAARGDEEITDPDDCLQRAAKWLEAGLKELGGGGKTAAGYGYFITKEEREAQRNSLREKAEAGTKIETTVEDENWQTLPLRGNFETNAEVVELAPGGKNRVCLFVHELKDEVYDLTGYKNLSKGEKISVLVERTNEGRVTLVRWQRPPSS